VPFDKFVQWQIAGDQLEPHNPLAVKATGFLAVGLMNGQVTEREAESVRYEVFDDWVGTTSTAFLGLTVQWRPLPRPQVRPDPRQRLLPPRR